VSAPQKKAAVGHLVKAQKCSQRQACRFIGLSRSSARYQARDRVDEAELVERLQKFAGRRRRRGYRLAHRELRRDGFAVNHKRVDRLWKGAGLSVPPRKTRKRIRGPVAPRPVTAVQPNGVWCIDFLEEKTFSGAKLRILCVSDEFTRESLAIETSRSFRSERVCRVLQEIVSRRGAPGALRMDNGPEFIALALRGLCFRSGINTCYIEPGKPWHRVPCGWRFAESFHARLRDELLDGEVFFSVTDAQVRLSRWRRDWNEERMHSSLAYVTPHQFAQQWTNELKIGDETKANTGS